MNEFNLSGSANMKWLCRMKCSRYKTLFPVVHAQFVPTFFVLSGHLVPPIIAHRLLRDLDARTAHITQYV